MHFNQRGCYIGIVHKWNHLFESNLQLIKRDLFWGWRNRWSYPTDLKKNDTYNLIASDTSPIDSSENDFSLASNSQIYKYSVEEDFDLIVFDIIYGLYS